MNRHVNAISNRLSLRPPQRQSLEILARVCEIATPAKDGDPAAALAAIRSEFPSVEDFEREFPSLCFALATGVGKTRLMGAFIAYLFQAEGIKNFFVLAPNLTIYSKLIDDFTPGTPKYVFKGIGEFGMQPPMVITGDTYESAGAVRGSLFDDGVHINIFNISKINTEVRGGSAPRIKRLSEIIGQSYFDYLAGLDDLVMLMDESHRYRASAGVRAINELKPVLGLELTATPQVEQGSRPVPFRNVIYSYPLSAAMTDGFVKEPAVATRENFDPAAYTPEGLERVKLEDGVRIHENTKVELEVFARNHDQPFVKPFLLVVAQDTIHAAALQQVVEGDGFFEGRYKGKVIQVHSALRGSEKDEVVQQLLTVEHVDNPVEIVIHVNMLKEGWDVTNLFTIVPLRAANSRTLVEQSIGRGLRLPYGKRVGVPAVDRLTIVSHDKFQEIVDHANDPDSIIRCGVVIGRDIPEIGRKVHEVPSVFEQFLSGCPLPGRPAQEPGQPVVEQVRLFDRPEQQAVAKATYQVIKQYERLRGSKQLLDEDVQQEIASKVRETMPPVQGSLEGIDEPVQVDEIVRETTVLFQTWSIDIPRIVVTPREEVKCRYADFDLDAGNIRLQPVSQDILIRHLHDHQQYMLQDGSGIVPEARPEDYLVRGLVDFDDICYEEQSSLLYKLAGQLVTHLRSYLATEDEVVNVLQYHQRNLVQLIHAQMQAHFIEPTGEYEATVTRGYQTLRPSTFTTADDALRNFRIPIPEGLRSRIGSMAFGGFFKSLYPSVKFDSDPERRFAVLLENDSQVLKWVRPGKGNLRIHYSHESDYEPDFIVETESGKFLCEPKRADQLQDPVVQAKAHAATTWCHHATVHARPHGGKPWAYLLIPHDRIQEQMTFAGLVAGFTMD